MLWPWQRRRWIASVGAARERARTARDLPVIALRDSVLLPDVVTEIAVGRPASLDALRAARDGLVLIVAQRDPEHDDPRSSDLYEMGCACWIERIDWFPEMANVRIHGLVRARRDGEQLSDVDRDDSLEPDVVALVREVARIQLARFGILDKKQIEHLIDQAPGPGRLADLIMGTLGVAVAQQQAFLEMMSASDRVRFVLDPDRFEAPDAKALELMAIRQRVIDQLSKR